MSAIYRIAEVRKIPGDLQSTIMHRESMSKDDFWIKVERKIKIISENDDRLYSQALSVTREHLTKDISKGSKNGLIIDGTFFEIEGV